MSLKSFNSVYKLTIYLTLTCFFYNCSDHSPHPTQISPAKPIEDNKVLQKSETSDEHVRLYFKVKNSELSFLGVKELSTFKSINPLSIPQSKRNDFWRLDLYKINEQNEKERQVSLFFKNPYNTSFKDDENYRVLNYDYDFFVDLPKTQELKLENLEDALVEISFYTDTNDQYSVFKQVEINNTLYNETPAIDGWNGEVRAFKFYGDKPSESAYDLVILGDGFTKEQMSTDSLEELKKSEFGKVVEEKVLALLEVSPYKERKDNINVWIVSSPSLDSGVDVPRKNQQRRTTFESTFGAYCSDRSLVVRNQMRALEFASLTPFDQVIVLVNETEYGGQGGDIATFSLNESATEVMIHELGHSSALLADHYHYLSDNINHQNCEDPLIKQRSYHLHKRYGRNQLFEYDSYLAPNLTLAQTKQEAKWKDLLTDDSPVVFFDHIKSISKFNENSLKLSLDFNFKNIDPMQSGSYERLFVIGASPRLNTILTPMIKTIKVNEQKIDFDLINSDDDSNGALMFIKVKDPAIEDGIIQVTFKSTPQDDLNEYTSRLISRSLANAQFFTSASTQFNAFEIGLFQGANPSLDHVFRPNYCTFMNSYECPFSEVEINAQIKVFDYYINN